MANLPIPGSLAEKLYSLAEVRQQSVDALLYDLIIAAEHEPSHHTGHVSDRILSDVRATAPLTDSEVARIANQRARQQQAVAEFGLQALSNLELPGVLDKALETICTILDVSYVNIFEYQQHDHSLLLRAGLGWRDGYISHYRISGDVDSLAKYALSINEPVIVTNLQEERRFRGADILHAHGIVSSMCVIINGKKDPYGVLCAHTTEPRQFTINDVHFFQAMANVLANAIQRLSYEARIGYQAQLLESTYDAILATDAQFRITAWNKAAEKMYGWKVSDAIGTHVEEAVQSGLSDEEWNDAVHELAATGFYSIELTHYHRDGAPIHVEGKIIALRDNEQRVTGYLAVIRDISERKQLRERLQQHATQSEAVARISRLIASVGLDHQAVLDVIVREIASTIGDMCVITTLSDDKKWLIPEAFFHSDPNAMEHIRRIFTTSSQPIEGAVAAVVEHGTPIMLPEMSQEEVQSFIAPDYKSYLEISGMYGLMIVPLVARGQVIGTLGASRVAPGKPYTTNDLQFLQLLAAQVALGVKNAQLHEEVQAGRDSLRLLMQEVVSAQEEERKRLSRELHDETGQALTALKIQLEQLLNKQDAEKMQHQVAGLIALTDSTIGYIRALAQDLRPPALDTLGLAVALEDYCEEFARRSDYEVRYAAGDMPPTSDAINITLYRVLQEALTNAARHAEASCISVDLHGDSHDVVLEIRDDGVGFDVKTLPELSRKRKTLGLIGMKERVEKLGGTLIIRSAPSIGTKLIARIPLVSDS